MQRAILFALIKLVSFSQGTQTREDIDADYNAQTYFLVSLNRAEDLAKKFWTSVVGIPLCLLRLEASYSDVLVNQRYLEPETSHASFYPLIANMRYSVGILDLVASRANSYTFRRSYKHTKAETGQQSPFIRWTSLEDRVRTKASSWLIVSVGSVIDFIQRLQDLTSPEAHSLPVALYTLSDGHLQWYTVNVEPAVFDILENYAQVKDDAQAMNTQLLQVISSMQPATSKAFDYLYAMSAVITTAPDGGGANVSPYLAMPSASHILKLLNVDLKTETAGSPVLSAPCDSDSGAMIPYGNGVRGLDEKVIVQSMTECLKRLQSDQPACQLTVCDTHNCWLESAQPAA